MIQLLTKYIHLYILFDIVWSHTFAGRDYFKSVYITDYENYEANAWLRNHRYGRTLFYIIIGLWPYALFIYYIICVLCILYSFGIMKTWYSLAYFLCLYSQIDRTLRVIVNCNSPNKLTRSCYYHLRHLRVIIRSVSSSVFKPLFMLLFAVELTTEIHYLLGFPNFAYPPLKFLQSVMNSAHISTYMTDVLH
jgi:hypothetical protein